MGPDCPSLVSMLGFYSVVPKSGLVYGNIIYKKLDDLL